MARAGRERLFRKEDSAASVGVVAALNGRQREESERGCGLVGQTSDVFPAHALHVELVTPLVSDLAKDGGLISQLSIGQGGQSGDRLIEGGGSLSAHLVNQRAGGSQVIEPRLGLGADQLHLVRQIERESL